MFKRTSMIAIILFFALSLSAIADTGPQVLIAIHVSDSETIGLLGELPLVVNYRGEGYIIAIVDKQDIGMLGKAEIEYEIIDEDVWSKPYYAITKTRGSDVGSIPAVGEVIFETEKETFVKIAAEHSLELIRNGFRPIRLSPKPLPLVEERIERTSPALHKAWSDEVIAGLVNKVSPVIARSYIQRLQDFETRFFASDSIWAAAQWLYDRFVEFGYTDVIFDDFVDPQYGVPVRNVIATRPGILYPDSVIIIGGHYDSIVSDGTDWFVWAPGANDNASGIAAVLEAARILSDIDLDCTVKFACWTAEEVGLFGSWHYVENAFYREENIGLYLNFDMIGYVDRYDPLRDVSVKVNSSAQIYADLMIDMTNQYTSLIPVQIPPGGASDHFPFIQYGYDIVYAEEGDFANNPHYHSATDIIDNVDIPYTCEVIKMGLATLIAVAGPPEMLPDPEIAIESYHMDDDNEGESAGNGNGCFDPGETVQLSLSLHNYGNVQVTDVAGQLVIEDPFMTILDDVVSFGDIPSGGTSTSEGQFRFRIAENCPNGHHFYFTIVAQATGGYEWTTYITAKVEQPEFIYNLFYFEEVTGDGDGALDPGEVVDLYLQIENNGLRDASGIIAELTTDDPDITITRNETVFPDVALFGVAENTGTPLTFSLDEASTPHLIVFTLCLSEEQGYYQTDLTFRLLIGQGTVLLVVDDGGVNNQDYYIETFQHLGVPYEVELAQVIAKSAPRDLQDYSEVIWFTGQSESNTLTPEDQSDLQAFLEGGGRLLLSGSMIGYEVGDTPFYRNYVHGRYVSFMTTLHHLSGVSMNPIVDEMDITLASEGTSNSQTFTGETDPISPAVSIFEYDRSTGEGPGIIRSSGSGALAVETAAYKLVYCSFGVEGIEPLGDRAQVLEDVLMWFKQPGVDKGDVDGNGTTDIIDAVVAVNIVLGTHQPDEGQLARADMNYDGTIDIIDVVRVVNAVLGTRSKTTGGEPTDM